MTKNLYLKLMVRKAISLFDEQGFNISEIKKEIIVSAKAFLKFLLTS